MKLAAVIFFGLLVYVHQLYGVDQVLDQPLSAFRYGDRAVLGYALFCAIALVGVVHTWGIKRFEEPGESLNTTGFGVLLLIVVATPSWWTLHEASAIVLLTSVYTYFSVVLFRSRRYFWMALHLSVPIVVAIATRFQSYGIWQKSIVCYFVVAAVIHHDVLKRGARARRLATVDPQFNGQGAHALRQS
jgi:hypothetical protein